MPSDKPDVKTENQPAEEAALAAHISAEHAVKAAEQAEADDVALRQATKDDPKARLCPNCHGEMVRHGDENPHKAGSYHCNDCGACWAPGIKQMREGHPEPGKPTGAAAA